MLKLKANLYRVDGTITNVEPETEFDTHKNAEGPALHWLYRTIGCDMVQVLGIEGGGWRELWIDEEGKYKNLQINVAATEAFEGSLFEGDFIVGNAVLTWVEEE